MYKEDFSKMNFLWLLCGQFGVHVMIWNLVFEKKKDLLLLCSLLQGRVLATILVPVAA